VFESVLDLRYAGQSFEIRVPDGREPAAEFEHRHERFYGYRLEEREIELVAIRLRALEPAPPARTRRYAARPIPLDARIGERTVRTPGRRRSAVGFARIDRDRLSAGHRFEGPALVEEYSGTSLVPAGWTATVVHGGHLVFER
jgi:N-methylhydantoinase A